MRKYIVTIWPDRDGTPLMEFKPRTLSAAVKQAKVCVQENPKLVKWLEELEQQWRISLRRGQLCTSVSISGSDPDAAMEIRLVTDEQDLFGFHGR